MYKKLLKGRSILIDYKKAFKWYSEAVLNGTTVALDYLAHMYAEGRGTRKDTDKAIALLKKAMKENESDAYFYLGSLCFLGEGVVKNVKKQCHF